MTLGEKKSNFSIVTNNQVDIRFRKKRLPQYGTFCYHRDSKTFLSEISRFTFFFFFALVKYLLEYENLHFHFVVEIMKYNRTVAIYNKKKDISFFFVFEIYFQIFSPKEIFKRLIQHICYKTHLYRTTYYIKSASRRGIYKVILLSESIQTKPLEITSLLS